ncbi:AAA family ATPase [Nocardioides sp.]|uniref:AAA family ATPase n=1 Tax=Nocardioides sp. TaxID=35761 RepID=UPI003D11926F
MHCTRIEVKGYKRLADTSTSLHRPLTAVVGLNEAGKSSLLQALRWLSSGGSLPTTAYNRSRPPAPGTKVVRAHFALSDDDLELIADIPSDVQPTSLVAWRQTDGGQGYELVPGPRRPRRPFDRAASQLATTMNRFAGATAAAADDEDEEAGPEDWADLLGRALAEPDEAWDDEDKGALLSLATWLDEVPSGRTTLPRNPRLAGLLREVHASVSADHPYDAAGSVLWQRVPRFVLFEDDNRVLESVHELSDEDVRTNPALALRDLLLIAELDLDALWTHIQNEDSSNRATALERGNDKLLTFFSQAWNQSNIAVRLNVHGTRLEVLVKELDDSGDVTNIDERSDGLRTFVALAAFVASGGYRVPPILLIDEAETHLHLNAQADLVAVLLKSLDATQVIYTTHSPGCLPSDLGTSIRLMSRDPEHGDASLLKHDFWTNNEPGFSPILFAMGAEAAAFSMCRNAVLGEGPTDMILLPSLIRLAVNVDDLPYQIAPGLATVSPKALVAGDIATNLLYLADGDAEGHGYVSKLREREVARERIFTLPKGKAPEDLVLRSQYVDAVNGLLDAMGQTQRVSASDLAGKTTVAKALVDWGASNKVRLPSKVDVAYALLERGRNLELTRSGSQALVRLHQQLITAFAVRRP